MVINNSIKSEVLDINVGIIKRFIAFIIFFVSLELILFYKDAIFLIAGIQMLMVILLNLWILKFKVKKLATYYKMIIPVLYLFGSIAFFILVPSKLFAHIYIVITSTIFIFIIKNIKNVKRYSENKELFNMNDIYLLITAFLVCSGMFGIYIFLYLPMWALILSCLLTMALLILQFFWSENIISRKNILYIPALSLVFCEITWALSFWPTGFASRAIVLFVIFYFIIGTIKLHLNNRFNHISIQKYIYVTIVVLALVLGTTRWYY